MRDPVQIVHDETGRVTTVPRSTVNSLVKSSPGWRLVSAPESVVVTTADFTPAPIDWDASDADEVTYQPFGLDES